MKFEEKLVRLRKEKGLSQLKVSERLGVSRQAISRWEVGAAMPSTENLKRLSDLYGVSVDYLLHDDSERPGPEASRQESPEGGDSMKKRWRPFVKLGAKMAAALLALFLCSVPLFYAVIFSVGGWQPYVAARVIRFLLAAGIGWRFRRKGLLLFGDWEPERKRALLFVSACIAVSLLLHVTGVTPGLYWTITSTLGMMGPRADGHIAPAVLWEQLFSGDLYWSILFCLAFILVGSRKGGGIPHRKEKTANRQKEKDLGQGEALDSIPEKFTARSLWPAAAVLLIFVLFAAQTGEETIPAANVKSGASVAQPEAGLAAAGKNPVDLGKADFTLDVAAADSVESPDIYETDSEKLRVKLKSPKHITVVVKVSLYDAAGQYLAGATKEIGAVRSAEWTFTGLAPHGKYYFKIENLDQRDAVLKGTAASI